MISDFAMIAQGVTIALIIWVLKGIHAINGSVKPLLQWKVDHEKQDDARHEEITERLNQFDRRKS